MKIHALAVLIVRGHGLAMLVVAVRSMLGYIYAYLDPLLSYQFQKPGAWRGSLTVVAIELALSFILFYFSQPIGRLTCRGLTSPPETISEVPKEPKG